jgi:enoyl-CoA hydratase/carnithine racemase
VGYAKASALLLSAATLSPSSPLLSDLYYSVLPTREEVFPAALKFAIELSSNTSQTAIAVAKGLIWRGADNIEEQHLLESRAIKMLGSSADAEEGAKAFKERRRVKFQDTLSNLTNWMPWVR